MARKTYIVGNWKMHLGPSEASLFVSRLLKEVPKVSSGVEVVLCPPVLDLTTVRSELRSHDHMQVGVQNIYPADEGAYTGETSAAMIKDLAKYAIVGHSERRHVFGERDGLIAQKLAACLRHGLTPILCVGEAGHDRNNGHAAQVVADQIEAGLTLLTPEDLHDIVIAYEPVWAIGTGENATTQDVAEMFSVIRTWLEVRHSPALAKSVPLLYGGSVKANNAAQYLALDDCAGLLVGGASVNYKEFAGIIESAK
ncbi:triose-phosphate isomerase [bacterium]|nr:triose-phosphate isomerase [bacterium]